MSRLVLVIGSKRYSSWSLRPWLLLRQADIAFDELVIRLRQDDTAARIAEHSPTGMVPLLKDGELRVWDSLAICEYVAELARARQLWPEARAARALARAVSAEMHSGFLPLRTTMPMDVVASIRLPEIPEAVAANIARIQAIWADCRNRFGAGGPFLFGNFTIADAMYAPVATRFRTYQVPLEPASQAYVETIYALPAMQDWIAAARSADPL